MKKRALCWVTPELRRAQFFMGSNDGLVGTRRRAYRVGNGRYRGSRHNCVYAAQRYRLQQVTNGPQNRRRVGRTRGSELLPFDGGSCACAPCVAEGFERSAQHRTIYKRYASESALRSMEETEQGSQVLHDMLFDPLDLSLRSGHAGGRNGAYPYGAFTPLCYFNIH